MDSPLSYALSILKFAGVGVAVWWGLKAIGVDPTQAKGGIVMALMFWGAVMVFFGKHMQGKNFWAGHRGSVRWVDTPTPAPLWTFAGLVLWAIALACLIFIP